MRARSAALAMMAVAVSGCAEIKDFVTPKDPSQTVYALEGVYAAALTAEVQYKQLPSCEQVKPSPISREYGITGSIDAVNRPYVGLCHDPYVMARMQTLDQAAWAAITTAQAAVTGGSSAAAINADVIDAVAAVQALQNLTTSVKVK